MASERAIVEGIHNALKKLDGLWHVKIHGGPFQMIGVPDIIGCYRGLFFGLEVKQPGKKPTQIQEHVMRQIRMAGGFTAVVHSKEEALAELTRGLGNGGAAGVIQRR